MMKNRICELFDIDYPIIQAGMIWCSPWQLASEVSNAGGLGIIGSGSMYPEVLREHVEKCKKATDKPFAVNIPLLYPNIEEHIQTIIDYEVPIVFSSAGNPKTWTPKLKEHGIKVVHVVSSAKFAKKAVEAGCDAVVAEGFEAGGHNGREETTTMCLIPLVKDAVDAPVIAAGGIGSGRSILAAMSLGADAVQIGSRFAASNESSGHENFKNRIVSTNEGDTVLTLKELAPVRLIKNEFYADVMNAYERCASKEELAQVLGRARAKKGMFEGDMEQGELEIGQVSAQIKDVLPAKKIFENLLNEYREARKAICDKVFDL
ncbi:nitronate monooxygenase [Salibacter sp.]|uniref:NAD(P)H-dependent flavin oxidoreductase n=1 Tax=Salibacter sp. TaxID=2010995 RepID=UPI00286FC55E|nr:nitronate monooxygenase [Salibacter sp.]MDR9398361.1 nitronate monooxygenase [Salibacter sp.]MDR9487206.1 nitronate monooxygenase [Salibacter sp.]